MTCPMYPSLIPRYVDECWFSSDQPVDEAAKLSELEASHDVWMREAQYRSVEVHTPHIEPIDDDANDDEDEDEMNEDDEEDGDDIEEGDDSDDDFDDEPNI